MEFGENGAILSSKPEDEDSLSSSANIHAFPEGPRSIAGLSRWAVGFLTAFMAVEIAWILVCIFFIWSSLPSTIEPFSQAQLVNVYYVIAAIGIIHSILYWVAAFFVARFTFRAMKNLHTIGSNFAEMSPGWAVGWYFIPVANLWQPAKGMSQIYNGTFSAIGASLPGESRIATWWTCWLVSNITANISFRMAGFDNVSSGIANLSFDLTSSVFGLLSAWALIRLIRPIAEKQELLKHGSFAQVFD